MWQASSCRVVYVQNTSCITRANTDMWTILCFVGRVLCSKQSLLQLHCSMEGHNVTMCQCWVSAAADRELSVELISHLLHFAYDQGFC